MVSPTVTVGPRAAQWAAREIAGRDRTWLFLGLKALQNQLPP